VLSILAALHYYAWRRLVRDPAWSRGWRRGLTIAIVALGVAAPASMTLWRWIGSEAAAPVSLVGATWMGSLFLLVTILFAADVVRGVRGATGWVRRRWGRREPAVNLERRRLLALTFAGVATVGTGGLTAAAVASDAAPPELLDVRVPVRRLPPAFEGYRILQLTDMHVGPTRGRAFVEEVVERANRARADLVAITGDLVDGSVRELAAAVAPLAGLRARDGVFFTTGNHEYYSGVDAWLAHLGTLGIRVLRNERVPILRGGQAFDLAGIDDAGASGFGPGHGADLPRALAGRDPARPVVLLAHRPSQVREAERLGVDVQLSGHTHGGQIWPFGFFVGLVEPAVKGLHRFGPTRLYVSSGTGSWGPPMRLATPSEITVVALTAE
jgi:predicted MPP superfamily phosphohydrolase